MNRAISPVSGFARGFRARMRRCGRRTVIALPASVISLFVSCLPAFADLKLCNRMSYVVEAAIGIDEKSATATRGWFRIDPAACRVVLLGALTADRILLNARALGVYAVGTYPVLAYFSAISSAAESISTTAGAWHSSRPACRASRWLRFCG